MNPHRPDFEQVQALLPDTVQQIAALIGFPATEALIHQFGGVVFPISKGLRKAGDRRLRLLQNALSPEHVALLIQHFSGEQLYIPRCEVAWRAWRNRCFFAEIDRLQAEGESLTMALTLTCPQYGIASTRGWELLRERSQPQQAHQDSLF